MSLSELKRKLQKGTAIKMTFNSLSGHSAKLNKIRYVVKVSTTGVYLNENKDEIKGSFLEFPKSSLLEMNEKGFKIFITGKRDLTEEEQNILNNEPSRRKENEEKCKIDLLTDGSQMFYKDKYYHKEHDSLWKYGKVKGLRYDYNENKMFDDNIKGDLSLEYEFI